MIIRVWGVVNNTDVEFIPVPNREGYWEGYAPRMPGLQDIEIWAESDSGLRGHLQCTIQIEYHAHTQARLILLPWAAQLMVIRNAYLLSRQYHVQLNCCRKAVIWKK